MGYGALVVLFRHVDRHAQIHWFYSAHCQLMAICYAVGIPGVCSGG